jgi:hypothetical protein
MLNKTCTRTAKSTPYPPCTVTVFWLKYQDSARLLRRVTQPPHIAGPLVVIIYTVKHWLIMTSPLPACPNLFAGVPWQIPWSTIGSVYLDKFVLHSRRKQACPGKLYSCMATVLVLLPGSKYRCHLYGLPEPALAYGNSRFCFFKFTKPVHEHHLTSFCQPCCKPAAVYRDRFRDFRNY